MASAILFAPTGVEARLSIAERAVMVAIGRLPGSSEPAALAIKLFERIKKLKETRNKIAHGSLNTVEINGKRYVRLTAPNLDFGRMKPKNRYEAPGLSLNQLRQAVRGVFKARHQLGYFVILIPLWRKSGPQACAEIIHKLKNPD
jgi:hypothetical protein